MLDRVLLVLFRGVVMSIPECILHIAHDLFGFTFDLLRGAFDLSLGVSRPLANLALSAASSIVNCALYTVLIHFSTSWCHGNGYTPQNPEITNVYDGLRSSVNSTVRPSAGQYSVRCRST